jgi:hypothetical protein
MYHAVMDATADATIKVPATELRRMLTVLSEAARHATAIDGIADAVHVLTAAIGKPAAPAVELKIDILHRAASILDDTGYGDCALVIRLFLPAPDLPATLKPARNRAALRGGLPPDPGLDAFAAAVSSSGPRVLSCDRT